MRQVVRTRHGDIELEVLDDGSVHVTGARDVRAFFPFRVYDQGRDLSFLSFADGARDEAMLWTRAAIGMGRDLGVELHHRGRGHDGIVHFGNPQPPALCAGVFANHVVPIDDGADNNLVVRAVDPNQHVRIVAAAPSTQLTSRRAG